MMRIGKKSDSRLRVSVFFLMICILFYYIPVLADAEIKTGIAADGKRIVALSVDTVSGDPGKNVDVSLVIKGCLGVDSLQCDINYDPAALRVQRVTAGDVFPKAYNINNPKEAGRIRLAAISADGIKEEGAVITITFTVLNEKGSAVTVTNAAVTTVDPEADYTQTPAYILLTDGGVRMGESLPQAVVTPWLHETPPCTPEPTAIPTMTPIPSLLPSTEPVPRDTPRAVFVNTPEPEPEIVAPEITFSGIIRGLFGDSMPDALVVIGILLVLAVLAVFVLLLVSGKRRHTGRKEQRKK